MKDTAPTASLPPSVTDLLTRDSFSALLGRFSAPEIRAAVLAVVADQEPLAHRSVATGLREDLAALGVPVARWQRMDVVGLLALAEQEPERLREALPVAVARLERRHPAADGRSRAAVRFVFADPDGAAAAVQRLRTRHGGTGGA